jgi:hypothetical protein
MDPLSTGILVYSEKRFCFVGAGSKGRMSINEDIKIDTKGHICGLFKVPSQSRSVGRPYMTSGLIFIRVTCLRILIRNQNLCA